MGGAGVSSVKDEPMVGAGPVFFGYVAFKFAFHGLGSLSVREADPVGNAEDVGVDGYYGFVIDD